MSNGSKGRVSKVIPFISRLEQDRLANLDALMNKAKMMKLEGFNDIDWSPSVWEIDGGRLHKQAGRNIKSVSINFNFSPKLGGAPLEGSWSDLAKSLLVLRLHRKNQNTSNQRQFITAVGYVAFAASKLGLNLMRLTTEALDSACKLLTDHYGEGSAYNLHKAVAEFASHCDANGLCRVIFQYKYAGMKRPENRGGVNHTRLDDPEVLETKDDKFLAEGVYKVIGELYRNVPRDHVYRHYILQLTLFACTGRRFTEVSLLHHQQIKKDFDGRDYIECFPKKSSQGNTFTPLRKLYLPTEVIPIVRDVLEELDKLCAKARDTAREMLRENGPDLRFLEQFEESKRFYKEDLEAIGISPGVLDPAGWIRKNGLANTDENSLNKNGRKSAYPKLFTTKEGVKAYCHRDFSNYSLEAIHIDQSGKKYYLNDLLIVRHLGLSSGSYAHWLASQCTHSMMTTFLRYFPDLANEFASSNIDVDFTSHQFRHTLNTLMDEGGLTELLQTEWFGRSNPRDTKSYQHTSREKRALMIREEIKLGNVGGKLAELIKTVPINMQDAVLKARVTAVHDVGVGYCSHQFGQTPCERHLQCSADCNDYLWVKGDTSRLEEQMRQYALTFVARETAEKQLLSAKPKKSSDWLLHNDKKLKTLHTQLTDNGVVNFDPLKYLEDLKNG